MILARRAKKIRRDTGRAVYALSELGQEGVWARVKTSVSRPIWMLITEPVVGFFTLWISFAWGILFLFFSSVVQTFSTNYGMGTVATGTVQLAITVGAVIGTIVNPLADLLFQKSAARNKERPGHPIPEARLYTTVPGSLLFTAGLFWYGWTSKPEIHWMVPAAGVACVGVGIYRYAWLMIFTLSS